MFGVDVTRKILEDSLGNGGWKQQKIHTKYKAMKRTIITSLNVFGLFLCAIFVDLLYYYFKVEGHQDYWYFAMFCIATMLPAMTSAYRWLSR